MPKPQSLLERLLRVGPTAAWAAQPASAERIYDWVADRRRLPDYLRRIRALLTASADSERTSWENPAGVGSAFFLRLVQSTAWQESCLRQFTVRDGKVVVLRSYNGSSVGVMQINERVWRGLYDLHRLRWEIRYNARAGCEILGIYLRRYALRRLDATRAADEHTLAGLVYAMYNGGPSQFAKFLQRQQTGELYRSDRLFAGKYDWVGAGSWDRIRECL